MPETTNLVTNTTLNSKINEVKNEMPSITNLAYTIAGNAKINEIENKIPNITNLAASTDLAVVENKIPDHNKYITTAEFNNLTAKYFVPRLAQVNL